MFKRILSASLVLTALLAGSAVSQTSPSKGLPESLCVDNPCREGGYKALLKIKDNRFHGVDVPKTPYVAPDGPVMLFPGETIAVQFDIKDGVPVNPRFLKRFAPVHPINIIRDGKMAANPVDDTLPEPERDGHKAILPENTVLFSFGQMEGLEGMVLTVESTFPEALKYKALMTIPRDKKFVNQPTSSCPVRPGIFVIEHWPHMIDTLYLHGFSLIPQDGDLTCR